MRYLFVLVSWILETVALQRWFGCWLFKTPFYFTQDVLKARVIEAINSDRGMPFLLTHAMHNKIIYFVWGSIQTLLSYFDLIFLKDFIGIIGALGLYIGLWYLFTTKRNNFLLWIIFVMSLLFSFTEMIFQPNILFAYKVIAFGTVFEALSLFGIWQFLQGKHIVWRYGVVSGLLLLSVCALIFLPHSFENFCLKI